MMWDSLSRYFKEFSLLKETRREYWGIQIINFLDALYSFAFLAICTVFLTKNLGFSDVEAGAALSWFGIITSICFFVVGPIVDRCGIRRALYLTLTLFIFVRFGLLIAAFWAGLPGRGWFFTVFLGFAGLPSALIGTIFQVGNRRFTTAKSQGAGFNIWYIVMNVGAVLAGLLVDVIHLNLHLDFDWVFAIGFAVTVLSWPIAWLMVRNEVQLRSADEPAVEPVVSPTRAVPVSGQTLAAWLRRAWPYVKDVARQPSFARMMAAVTLLVGVRATFLYWSILSPKYWYRVIGPEARVGALETINPILIVFGLLLLVPIIGRFNTFRMLTYGALVAAVSFLPMVLPWRWLNCDYETAYYAMSIVAMVVFSVGEIMWSPRLSQYIVAIAPLGQEGVYSSFSAMPWFVGKTIAGFFSGVLLARWCPEKLALSPSAEAVPLREALEHQQLPYADSPEMMWLILGVIAVVGPIIMILLRRWFLAVMKENAAGASGDATSG